MSIKHRFFSIAAAAVLIGMSVAAIADDHSYTEGPVVNVAKIRTVDGRTNEYLDWLATKWKAQEEAGKKLGQILSYEVARVEPRGPDDPDILLMITYKNWAALDNATARGDAVLKELNETMVASNQAQASRSAIRRILGSYTMQVLKLK
jgi:hypothetical protein